MWVLALSLSAAFDPQSRPLRAQALVPAEHPATEARQASGSRLVLGYYVPYDAGSWASLEAHADQLDLVALQWATIDACGGLSSRDDQTLKAFARGRGLKIEPSLLTGSAWLNHQILTDDAVAAHAIEQMVAYTLDEGYDGFDLDLESIDASDQSALSSFVGWLASALHDQGKLLTVAIPARDRDVTSGWSAAFDYAAIGAQADLVTVMAYEYRGPFSGPGSVAPIDWVTRVSAYASAQIPPERLLLGLAFYGYDWNTTSGGASSVGYQKAVALADYYQAVPSLDPMQQSLTFGYTAEAGAPTPTSPPAPTLAHEVTTRTAAACPNTPPPTPARTPTPAPSPGSLQDHQVWLEESSSAAARLGVARASGLRGVATWRLGLEDPGVWPLFEQWRGADQGR